MVEVITEAELIWEEILPGLALRMSEGTYQKLFWGSRGVRIDNSDPIYAPVLTVELVNEAARQWVMLRWKEKVPTYAKQITGRDYSLAYTVRGAPEMAGAYEATESADEERMRVDIMGVDPQASGWMMVSIYVQRYWQPYLGRGPYGLWEVLVGYGFSSMRNGIWPSIATLAAILSVDRYTITGRRRNDAWHEGYIDVLERELVIKVGKDKLYSYKVREKLPLLTPVQAATLTTKMQSNHRAWLDRNLKAPVPTWEMIKLPTFCK